MVNGVIRWKKKSER